MSKSARRLGRGLNSLVSNLTGETAVEEPEVSNETTTRARPLKQPLSVEEGVPTKLPIGSLKPNPFQPRDKTDDESIITLARSIEHSGILQPIAVRRNDNHYEIIAGERRWTAAKSIGMREIPVLVREATDEQMLELALIENIQREDLNAVDRARAYRQFCDRFGLKPEEVAARLGEDRTTVVNYIRLLELPEAILGQVAAGGLSMGHARCLLGVTEKDRQARLAQAVVTNSLSVRALEEIVRRERTRPVAPDDPPARMEPPRSAHLESLQRRFEEALRTKVVIREGRRKGSGRVVIEFYSLDDFDRIADALGVTLE